MKVGDFVKWCIVNSDDEPLIEFEYGTIIEMRDPLDFGKRRYPMALILFTDGTRDWIGTRNLEVISEA